MTEKKIRKATTTEIIAINNLLRDHLAKTPEGNYSYLGDWSDAKIAAEVDPTGGLSASAIARVRLEVFGSIKPPEGPRRQEIEEIYRHLL